MGPQATDEELQVKVGFIGLGKMGRPMTEHLLKAGFTVTVHNRSRGVVEELAKQGAQPADSPRAVAAASEIVCTCLPTPAAVEQVYLGEDGLIPHARAGQILVDHSTVGPELSRRLAEAARQRGAFFLDAPISGGPAGAAAGTLTSTTASKTAKPSTEAVERARPVFAAMGKHLHHVGPNGAGSVIKLANQLMVAINMAGVVEALVLATKAGADPQQVLEVIGTSFGGSFMLQRAVPLILQRRFQAGTPINIILKDLGLIESLAFEQNVRLLMGGMAKQVFAEGRFLGLGDLDMVALVEPLERMAGVRVERPQAVGG